MAEGEPSPSRGRLLRITAALAAVAAVAGALKLGGLFDGDEASAPEVTAAPGAPQPARPGPEPDVETLDGAGNPVAVAAHGEEAWVADGLDATAALIQIPYDLPLQTSFSLPAPSSAVAVGEGSAWFALQDEGLQRLDLEDPADDGETYPLDEVPADVEVDGDRVWTLVTDGVDRIDPENGEVTDHFAAGGFANAFAVTATGVWVIADNREVTQIDPKTGEAIGDRVEIAGAESLAVDARFAWVVSSSGAVTRLDDESLSAVGTPIRVPHAVDVAIGGEAVWVAAADGRVTQLDARTGARVGRPIRVGRHASSIDADGEAVWVVSARGGTVTRITP
jgi:hypothetical protein